MFLIGFQKSKNNKIPKKQKHQEKYVKQKQIKYDDSKQDNKQKQK